MNLRLKSTLSCAFFHFLSYCTYRRAFRKVTEYFELLLTKIYPHGARGNAAFLAHQRGQQASQISLIGHCKSHESLALYINNAKAHLASLKLSLSTRSKLQAAESHFLAFSMPKRIQLNSTS